MITRYCFVAALIFGLAGAERAMAQSGYAATVLNNLKARNSVNQFSTGRINQQIRNQAVPPAGVGGINKQNFLGPGSGPAALSGTNQRPFSQIDRGPAVSPYLTLSNPFSTPSDFYNIVRPQQEQRRINDQLMRQQNMQAHRLNQMAAQGPYEVTGSERFAPTGHRTGFMQFGNFMNTGGFFPRPVGGKDR